MKTTNYLLSVILMFAFHYTSFTATAQEKNDKAINGSENPYPLNDEKKDSLLNEAENTIAFYRQKYTNPNLSTWDESDRNTYLIARSKRVALLIVPVYYRIYPTKEPTIEKKVGRKEDQLDYGGKILYEISFYANPKLEDILDENNILFQVEILEENGEPSGISIPVTMMGQVFFPPRFEDDNYERIKKGSLSPFKYFTGYELMLRPASEKSGR